MTRAIAAAALLLLVDKPPVVWNPSPNDTASNRPSTYLIDSVVIHTTEGSDTNGDGYYIECYTQAINWFKNSSSQVSAHYVVSPAGEITQMVADKDIAWHATYYNKRSIGIECAGFASQPGTWTPELLDALTSLVAWLCKTYGIPAVHPTDTAITDGGYLTVSGIVGHNQVQTAGSAAGNQYGSKSDPGPYFPWDSFIAGVNAKLAPPAPTGLNAVPYLSGSTASADLSWNASPGADGYWVDIAKSESDLASMTGSFQNGFAGAATSMTWTNLEPGTTYCWRVWAYNGYGGNHGYPSGPFDTPAPAPSGGGSSGGSSGGSGGCGAGRADPDGAAGSAALLLAALAILAAARRR